MRRPTEGMRMWLWVMAIFVVYAAVSILFEDFDKNFIEPFNEINDVDLVIFSLLTMTILGTLLYHYARRMDQRISREQLARQNKMRRELTQNIAHELKTPVASILGYTDTILDNPDIDAATREQFIRRTNSQARRLSALLQDISTLTRMDYAPELLSRERIDVSVTVADIVAETALAARQHDMTISNCLKGDITIRGNWTLVYGIFRNLMDNAINYAGRSTTIRITAEERGTAWAFCFQDNGVGVPPEHLPRIFERFYRLDKGRSRLLGGTGLGLSIVKNAVELHGGSIVAECVEGGGLRFRFTLQK